MLKNGNWNNLTDEELCLESRNGDREAENVLAERYLYIVRAAARSYYLAGGDQEDLIQEGMLGLLNAIREYDESRGSFAAFAQRCVKNRLISGTRAASREKHRPLNNYLGLDDLETSGGGIPSERERDPVELLLEHESYLEVLEGFRSALSSFESKVLDLYLEGLTTAEMAETLRKPGKSVENAIARIRRKLSFKTGQ